MMTSSSGTASFTPCLKVVKSIALYETKTRFFLGESRYQLYFKLHIYVLVRVPVAYRAGLVVFFCSITC